MSLVASKLNPPAYARRPNSFSLIELLVVLALIAILVGLLLPSFSGVQRGQALQHAGETVANALTVARENALTKNRQVNIRFVQAPNVNGQNEIRGIQSWIINDSNVAAPLTKMSWLPDGMAVSLNANLSPLLSVSNGTMSVGGMSRSYYGFNFLATGAPNTNAFTFVTVVSQKDIGATAPPTNFRSVWVNPITGEIHTFSP